jgi:hypothetical protein
MPVGVPMRVPNKALRAAVPLSVPSEAPTAVPFTVTVPPAGSRHPSVVPPGAPSDVPVYKQEELRQLVQRTTLQFEAWASWDEFVNT